MQSVLQEDIRTKGKCCFWHIIGLPQKDGHDMPVLPYQRTLLEALQNHKHIWIKKSGGGTKVSYGRREIKSPAIRPSSPANPDCKTHIFGNHCESKKQ